MRTSQVKEAVGVPRTPEQREQASLTRRQDGDTVELRVEELEERIAPKLASNHNETFWSTGSGGPGDGRRSA